MNWRNGAPCCDSRGGARLRPRDDAADAEIRMAAEALRTVAAEAGQAGDDVVAGLHRRHVGAHRLDDAGALVAEHDRAIERKAADPIDHVQIAMAHAGGGRAHQDLAAPRLVDLDGFDGQRLLHLPEHGGLSIHTDLLVTWGPRHGPQTPALVTPRGTRALSIPRMLVAPRRSRGAPRNTGYPRAVVAGVVYLGITSVANSSIERIAWAWLRSPHWNEHTK